MLLLLAGLLQDSLFARKVLLEAEARIRQTHTLVYHSDYRQTDSGLEDSVFAISGTQWLERAPGDTIFGYHLHVRGDGFDYFYNGKLCHEYRSAEKEVTEFDPRSSGNAYKARVALVPLFDLETDTALVDHLMRFCAGLSIADSGAAWVITAAMWPNASGAQSVRRLWMDKDTYRIVRSEVTGYFNGTRFTQRFVISGLTADGPVADSLLEPDGLHYKLTRYVKPGPPKPSPLEGAMAADFTYTSFDGRRVRLRDLRGNYVLLDFWESWCGWCIDAFPHLTALDSAYRGRNFRLLSIVTENLSKVQAILDGNRVSYSTLKGDGQVLKDYQVEGRPTYVLIDPSGRIIAYGPGDLDRMKALLAARLGAPVTAAGAR